MINSDTAVSVENLSIAFGETIILDNVSLRIKRGSITGIIGPNGAGKTTLFHSISGDLPEQKGKVKIGGATLRKHTPAQVSKMGIGRLFQDVRVFKNLSLYQNLRLSRQTEKDQTPWRAFLKHPSRSQRFHENYSIARIAKTVGLLTQANVLRSKAGELSFGRQKMLAFARLIAGDFHTFLLDEPFAGISHENSQNLENLIKHCVKKQRRTVLLIEHNHEHIKSLCDEVIVLNQGKVFRHGPSKEILNDPKVRDLCLGL